MKQKKRKKSTLRLLGITEIRDSGVVTESGEIAFLLIAPTNIGVLSQETLRGRIEALSTFLKGVEQADFVCLDSRESFEANKQHLRQRLQQEDVPQIRRLLELDTAHFDEIQTQSATAREFLISIPVGAAQPNLGDMVRLLNSQGFFARQATERDLRRIMAVYFQQAVIPNDIPLWDGAQYVEEDA